MPETIHDVLGVGVGPFNLGLAALCEPIDDLDAVFIDDNPHFEWHPGLLIDGVTLQTPFMADLVTLADPTSPYSFLNFLKHTGRLYAFYIRESFFVLREEYNQYCRWVAERLDSLRFSTRAEAIEYDAARDCYAVHTQRLNHGTREVLYARHLVLGTGPVPRMPECCRGVDARVIHASDYLDQRAALTDCDSITLVGSGQSAAEIFYDLVDGTRAGGYRLDWFTRSPRFFSLQYDKLTLEMTSPEYIDYFHALGEDRRDALGANQHALYKGIDEDLINAIYDRLYALSVSGTPNVGLMTNVELRDARAVDGGQGVTLGFHQHEQQRDFSHRSAALILATGYAHVVPDYVEPIADRIRWDSRGRYDVTRDYAIDVDGERIFVQNAELHTHGFTASDLGMACYRNACILKAITGVEHYPIERRIAFQQFGVSEPLETLAPARVSSA